MNDKKEKLIEAFKKAFGFEPDKGYSAQRYNALNSICKNRYKEEDIIHIADSSVLNNGKAGLVLTTDSICVKDAKNSTSQFIIRYDEIENTEYKKEHFWGTDLIKLRLFKDDGTHYAIAIEQINKKKLQKYITEAKKIVTGTDDNKSDEWGLVLSGGGAKGAYQIGIWKYLNEHTENVKITGTSGASVGALNACLFACGDYQKSESIWKNITMDKILTFPNIGEIELPFISMLNISGVAEAMPSLLHNNGFFSRKGLIEIINSAGVCTAIKHSKIKCFADCLNIQKLTVEYFQLNKQETAEQIRQILLASSAIPGVFSPEKIPHPKDIQDKIKSAVNTIAFPVASFITSQTEDTYMDGGTPIIGNNTPIEPLYNIGYKKFIVVYLNSKDQVNDDIRDDSGVKIKEIRPSQDLGNLISGTLNFNQEYICTLMELGYQDAKEQLARIM